MKSSIRHIKAIFLKEIQDYRRNPAVLIVISSIFIVFLVLLEVSRIKHGSNNGISYIAIVEILTCNISFPCTVLPSSYIVEEKEKRTLDALMLSGVSPLEFLIGKNLATICVTMVTSTVILILFKINFIYIPSLFILVFIIIISEVILMSLIGIIANNSIQNLIYSLVFIVILFLAPTFSYIKAFYNINRFINVSNMNFMIKNILDGKGFFYSQYSLIVITLWLIVPLMLFVLIYKTKKLY